MSTQTKGQRIEYYDFLRGIAIIMVVCIHTFTVSKMDTPVNACNAYIRQILNCAVPIFLALSGYFCGKKILSTKREMFKFWRKQIPKVYLPTLFWSLPYLLISIKKGDMSMDSITIDVLMYFICGLSIYYFIALIIQFYLLLPILQKYSSVMMPLSVISSFLSIIFITYINDIKGTSYPLIIYAGTFVVWFVFFMLGIHYSKRAAQGSLKPAITITVIGLILEICETYWLNTNYSGGFGIKTSSFIYSIGVVMLILSPKMKSLYKSNRLTSIVAYIGNISFGIYLVHCLIIEGVRHFIKISNWGVESLIILLVTAIFIMFARKILPSNINRLIGFQ